MTTKEKRNEIYQYIQKEFVVGKNKKWQGELSKLLKEYSEVTIEELANQPIKLVTPINNAQKETVKKIKAFSPKLTTKLKSDIQKVLTGKELKEYDLKRGIWRPDSDYDI